MRSFTIDIDADDLDGLVPSAYESGHNTLRAITDRDALDGAWTLVSRSQSPEREYDPVDIGSDSLVLAIHMPTLRPLSGILGGAYNGVAFATPIAVPVTASALSTMINANAGITADGGVTVTAENSDNTSFLITWNNNGARVNALTIDPSQAHPSLSAEVIVRRLGSATMREVRSLKLAASDLVYYEFTTILGGSCTAGVADIQTGSTTKNAVHRVTLTGSVPHAGQFVLNTSKAEVLAINCRNNKGVANVTTVTCSGDTAGSLHGLYFDLYDNVGAVRVYYKENGTAVSTPTTPSGGRLVQIVYVSGDAANVIALKTSLILEADAKFAAYSAASACVVTDSNVGARTAANAGTSTFSVAATTAGTNGKLAGKYFLLYDSKGSVGVWFSVSGEDVPAGADAAGRVLEVALAIGDTAASVATKLAAVLDPDGEFAATAAGNVVTVTCSIAGSRTDAADGDSGCGLTVTTKGVNRSALINYNATAAEFGEAYGTDDVMITKPDPLSWTITYKNLGARSLPTVDAANLEAPLYFEGQIPLATLPMYEAFCNSAEDKLEAVLTVRHYSSVAGIGDWRTIYRQPITIYRSAVLSGNVPAAQVSGVPIAIYRHELAAGVAGGSSGAATWNIRSLNAEVSDRAGIGSLAASQVTLVAGTYRVQAYAPCFGVGRHRLRLWNATDAAVVVYGTCNYTGDSNNAFMDTVFTIGASKALELHHYTTNAQANGLGLEVGAIGFTEYYATLAFTKIA